MTNLKTMLFKCKMKNLTEKNLDMLQKNLNLNKNYSLGLTPGGLI